MKQLQVLFYNKVVLIVRISLSNVRIQSESKANPKRIQNESNPIQSNAIKAHFFQLSLHMLSGTR